MSHVLRPVWFAEHNAVTLNNTQGSAACAHETCTSSRCKRTDSIMSAPGQRHNPHIQPTPQHDWYMYKHTRPPPNTTAGKHYSMYTLLESTRNLTSTRRHTPCFLWPLPLSLLPPCHHTKVRVSLQVTAATAAAAPLLPELILRYESGSRPSIALSLSAQHTMALWWPL